MAMCPLCYPFQNTFMFEILICRFNRTMLSCRLPRHPYAGVPAGRYFFARRMCTHHVLSAAS